MARSSTSPSSKTSAAPAKAATPKAAATRAPKASTKVPAAKSAKSTPQKTSRTAITPLKVPKTSRWTPQEFMVQHLAAAKFRTGLRSYAAYRDLGIHKATHGAVQAHVIRLKGPCDPAVVSIRHLHGVQFQFLYMLKGWLIGEYNGRRIKMEEGSCWLQPNSIPHTVLDYSDNCEMIELILPGEFKTVEL